MKRRWRRFILTAVTALLVLCLIGVGVAVWLHQSGRLAGLSEDLIERLSGQDVTIGSIKFASWDTVVLTDVRLSQRFSGWRLAVHCPQLEVRYGLAGLLNKQIDTLKILQPQVELSRHHDSVPPPQPSSQPVGALPLKRLIVQQGTVHIRWDNRTYTVRQLNAILQPQDSHQLRAEVKGTLDGTSATLQLVADITLNGPQPTGRVHLTVQAIPLSRLIEMLPQTPPLIQDVSQGTLDLNTDLQVREHTLQGTVTATVSQATMQVQGVSLRQATLSTEATLNADRAKQTFRLQGRVSLRTTQAIKTPEITLKQVSASTQLSLEINAADQTLHASGQARLQAERANTASDVRLTNVLLTAPWRLSHASDRWQATATPTFRSHTARLGALLHASRLSLSTDTPIQIRPSSDGLRIQATPELKIDSLSIHARDETDTPLRITGLQGRLSVRGGAMALEIADARLQTQAWHWQNTAETPLLEALMVQSSGTVDLQHQQLTLRDVTATLPQLGKVSGSGTWDWSSQTLHDLQVRLVPDAVDVLWEHVKPTLPTDYQDWQIGGHTELSLQTARVSLRAPRDIQKLTIDWQIRDGEFTSPDSTYASEHLNGTIQASAAFDAAAHQYTLQGTLTLAPFALLVGSFFPAIEDNHISSVITFSGVYTPEPERLNLNLSGQFRDLGTVTLQGTVHRPRAIPRYAMQLQVSDLQLTPLWKTVMHDPIRFPTLSQATVQGTLNAMLRLNGQASNLHLEGSLELTEGHLDIGSSSLQGVSLSLPVQGQHPLPKTVPGIHTLPPDAYGQLSVERLRIGSVEIDHFTTRLALQSDNIVLQPSVNLPLWGGQVLLENVTAQHVLQPHRRITWGTRLHGLDLQRLPRGTAKLPLAGVVDGDFPRLAVLGDRLEAQGSLTIAVADGTIRLFDLQGRDLFSSFPVLRFSMATEQPLSLLRLTDIYPIGVIGGTMHFTLTDLTLVAGEPEAFSLDFDVQKKRGEKRQITLRALNNLLFTTGSTKVASGVIGDTQSLPYKHFGVLATLRHDTLRLRGKHHDRKGNEYFMRAPALGAGVSIINRVPDNGIPFRDFLKRLKATVLEKPDVRVK